MHFWWALSIFEMSKWNNSFFYKYIITRWYFPSKIRRSTWLSFQTLLWQVKFRGTMSFDLPLFQALVWLFYIVKYYSDSSIFTDNMIVLLKSVLDHLICIFEKMCDQNFPITSFISLNNIHLIAVSIFWFDKALGYLCHIVL